MIVRFKTKEEMEKVFTDLYGGYYYKKYDMDGGKFEWLWCKYGNHSFRTELFGQVREAEDISGKYEGLYCVEGVSVKPHYFNEIKIIEEHKLTNIFLIQGFRGSGKTTKSLKIARDGIKSNRKVCIINQDFNSAKFKDNYKKFIPDCQVDLYDSILCVVVKNYDIIIIDGATDGFDMSMNLLKHDCKITHVATWRDYKNMKFRCKILKSDLEVTTK